MTVFAIKQSSCTFSFPQNFHKENLAAFRTHLTTAGPGACVSQPTAYIPKALKLMTGSLMEGASFTWVDLEPSAATHGKGSTMPRQDARQAKFNPCISG